MERAARWCPDATGAEIEAAVGRLVREVAQATGSLPATGTPVQWPSGGERDLLEAVEELVRSEGIDLLDGIRPIHPMGGGPGPAGETCSTCAWWRRGACASWKKGPGRAPRTAASTPSCSRWETALSGTDCGCCGACCREGYTSAPARRGEAVHAAHPEWIVREGRQAFLPRPGGRCVALDGNGSTSAPWRCRDYGVRPRACAELEPGSLACLVARRRVGLSR